MYVFVFAVGVGALSVCVCKGKERLKVTVNEGLIPSGTAESTSKYQNLIISIIIFIIFFLDQA